MVQTSFDRRMAYKPLHLVTNDDSLVLKLIAVGLHHEQGAEDYTEEEGLHYHYLINWPINTAGSLSPTRQGAVGRWRRIYNPCDICFGRNSNYKCQTCGLFYKFIWATSPEHHENIKAYIQRKIDENPLHNVDWTPDT